MKNLRERAVGWGSRAGVVLIVSGFAAALVSKAVDFDEGSALLSASLVRAYGVKPEPVVVGCAALAADALGLLAGALAWRFYVLALVGMVVGSAFTTFHVVQFTVGGFSQCGCFGGIPMGSYLAPVVSLLLVGRCTWAVRDRGSSRGRWPVWPFVMALSCVVAVAAPALRPKGVRTPGRWALANPVADGEYVFVFDPKCPECIDAGSSIARVGGDPPIIGVVWEGAKDLLGFRARTGAGFEVVEVPIDVWFDLVSGTPPTIWRVFGGGVWRKTCLADLILGLDSGGVSSVGK